MPDPTVHAAPTEASDRARWIALYVLCVGMLMIVLDATVVNVALPSVQEDLAFTDSSLAWVVNAYLIAFGGLLLLAGRLGDLIGQRLEDGVVYHTYSTYARGPEVLDGAYHLLDRAPKGRAEDDSLPHPGMWWRRHDEYGDTTSASGPALAGGS